MNTETLKKMSIPELMGVITENAKAIPKMRDCSALKVGEVCRQGDVYIQFMGEGMDLLHEIQNRQLVPGTTNGSRHIVQEDPHTRIYKTNPSMKYRLPNAPGVGLAAGPGVVSDNGWTLLHPTHPACFNFPKGGCQIWYQIDAKTNQRAKD
jgi:hypothetical protein